MMTNMKYALSFVFGGVYCLSWRTLFTAPHDPNNLWLVIPVCIVIFGSVVLFYSILGFFMEYWDED